MVQADLAKSDRTLPAGGAGSLSARGLVIATLAAGLMIRVWMLLTPLGALDSDEAIVGLMARHVLTGELPAMYWGQAYGGSHDALLAALLFVVFGSGTLALKLVPIALSAAAAWLVWRIGRRTVGEPAATWGALLFWVWPASFVFWSTKARGGHYWAGLVVALAFLLAAIAWKEAAAPSKALALGLGLLLGLGWWAGPQILYFAIPAVLWLAVHRGRRVWNLWPVIPATLIGALPWLYFNLHTGWGSLQIPAQPETSYLSRLAGFFLGGLPAALGPRVPYSCNCLFYNSEVESAWVPPYLGPLLYLAAVGLILWVVLRRPPGAGVIAAIAAVYPFLFALSPFSWYVDFPAYLLFLAPVVSLLLGSPIARLAARSMVAAAGAVVVAAAVTLGGLASMIEGGHPAPYAYDVQVPADLSPLLSMLREEGVDTAFADYWIAYRISFESEEEIIATPPFSVRYLTHDRLVRESPRPAYVFLEGSALDPGFGAAIQSRGIDYRRAQRGAFVVYILSQKVLPGDVPEVWP